MAKQYPFQLDPFQSTAVACLVRTQLLGLDVCRDPPTCTRLFVTRQRHILLTLALPQERKESVLVAAHTSAGKTAVAE